VPERKYEVSLIGKDRISGTLKQASGGFGGLAGKIAAAAGAYISFQAATRFVQSAIRKVNEEIERGIKESNEYEQAAMRLAQAMRASGNYTEISYQSLLRLADARQQDTVFTTNQILKAEAMLATFKLNEEKMRLALDATLDLAAGTSKELDPATIDLTQHAILMGKAMVGVTGRLSQYGIIIDQADLKARGFRAVLDEINKEFGGQAKILTQTYMGSLGMAQKSWADLTKEAGDFITKSPAIRGTLQTISESLWTLAGALGSNETAAAKLNDTLTKELVRGLKTIAVVLPHLEAGWRGLSLMAHLMQRDFKGAGQEAKELFNIWKSGRGIYDEWNERLQSTIDRLEVNIRHQESLRWIQNRTKDDLPMLIKYEAQMVAVIDKLGIKSQNSKDLLEALRLRIKDLGSTTEQTIKKIPKQIIEFELKLKPARLGATEKWEKATYERVTKALEDEDEKRRDLQLQFNMDYLTALGSQHAAELSNLEQRRITYEAHLGDKKSIDEWYAAEYRRITKSEAHDWEVGFRDVVSNGMYSLSDRLVDAMFDTKAQFKDIWKAMYKDAMRYFFQQVIWKMVLLPMFSGGGTIQQGQYGGTVPGPRRIKRDVVPTVTMPGEKIVPVPQSDKYAPLLDAMIREKRTGIPALRGMGGGTTINHYHTWAPQLWDVDSVRSALRRGTIQKEFQYALDDHYIETS